MIWVRSQDKKTLLEVTYIHVRTYVNPTSREKRYWIYGCKGKSEEYNLGNYSSEEKAMKVLDTIQRYIHKYDDLAYQMPKDEEVEV